MHKLNLAYLRMLNTLYDIEDQLHASLSKLIEHAHNTELKNVLLEYREMVEHHQEHLTGLFSHHNYSMVYERNMAFSTFVHDTLTDVQTLDDQNVKDAFLAASVQVIAHSAIARYRTLLAWAKELGDEKGHEYLKQTLADEEKISRALFALTEGGMFNIGLDEKAAITGDI